MSFLSGLAGALGGDGDLIKGKVSINKIKKVMLQSIRDMANMKLADSARVLALKNFEESRSTLEDTAKNYPNPKVREYALNAAREVLSSSVAKNYFEKRQVASKNNLGYSGPPLYNQGLGSVYGVGGVPYGNLMNGASLPDFMR